MIFNVLMCKKMIGGIKAMNNRKRLMEAALLILVVAGMICYGTKGSEEWEDNHRNSGCGKQYVQ